MVTLDDLDARMKALEKKPKAMPVDAQCDPLLPHDTMVFQRGPNVYRCACGMLYKKDGKGGLQEVV